MSPQVLLAVYVCNMYLKYHVYVCNMYLTYHVYVCNMYLRYHVYVCNMYLRYHVYVCNTYRTCESYNRDNILPKRPIILQILLTVATQYRVAQSHRMPYLRRSFSTKEPYNQWLFCKKDLQLKASYGSSTPCRFFYPSRQISIDLVDFYILLTYLQKSDAMQHASILQGGEDPQDALSCMSCFAKEPLIIRLFCGK